MDIQNYFIDCVHEKLKSINTKDNAEDFNRIGNLLIDYKIFDDEVMKQLLEHIMNAGYPATAKKLLNNYKKMIEEEYEDEPDGRLSAIVNEKSLLRINRREQNSKFHLPVSFFCRDNEISLITDDFRNFMDGNNYSSLLITGEAGVGKSALLYQVSSAINPKSAVVLRYQCVQSEVDLYLRPWSDLLAQIELFILNKTTEITHKSTDINIPSSLFATQFEQNIKIAFDRLREFIGDSKKIILVIDDIQWMDYASIRLLANIITWGKNNCLLAILAARNELSSESNKIINSLYKRDLLTEIPLSRFTYEESKKIIATYHPALAKEKKNVDSIYDNTAGNALFLLEFLKDYNPDNPNPGLTRKTVIMIQNRLLELTTEEQNILNIISLFPRFATLRDLQIFDHRSLNLILMDIEHLLYCQLICFNNTYFNNGYAFSHQLIRNYIYNQLLPDKKIIMHSIIAEEYEKDYSTNHASRLLPSLIHHFTGANNLYKAYNYQLEYFYNIFTIQNEIYPSTLNTESCASIRLQPLSSSDALISLAKKIRALDASVPDADLLKMKVEFLIGRYDLYSGSFDHGLKNISNSISIALQRKDSEYLLKNYLQMIFHAIQVNNLKMFNDYLTLCEELIQTNTYDKAIIFTIKRLRGLFLMKNYRYKEAEEIFVQITTSLSEEDIDEDNTNIALAACSNYIGECKQMTDQPKAALSYFFKAIEYTKNEPSFSGVAIFLLNVGQLYYRENDFPRAEKYIDKALEYTDKTDALWGKAKANAYKALLEIQQEHWDSARKFYDRASSFANIGKNPLTLTLLEEVNKKLQTHQAS
ncbi:MAG: AAA family ATPase [Acidaminococcus sp.]|nr:AAA family ATPase [Acidaminococcus sp.]